MAKKATTKKTATKAAKKATTKKTATPPKAAPAPAAVKKTTVKKTTTKKVAKKKLASAAPPPAPSITTIVAKADVGFGNSLYVRGGGAGLSWEKGVVMGNAGSDEWVWSTDSVDGTLEFKVLINDEIWAEGENCFVEAGARCTIEPSF